MARRPIVKEEPNTLGEKKLSLLAHRSFLSMWTYPSLYRDQRSRHNTDGKELCDTLLVFDNDIIVFSEKSISWPNGDIDIAWSRWFDRAIVKSAKQSLGAERWIRNHPDRIFLDRACAQKFPFEFPSEPRFHHVLIATGCGDAVREYFNRQSDSLVLSSKVSGEDRTVDYENSKAIPFVVGDLYPDKAFVHILANDSISKVFEALDTPSDFIEYLSKKEALFRSKGNFIAESEEDLLAYYATNIDEHEEHGFPCPIGSEWRSDQVVQFKDHYSNMRANPQYLLKVKADRDSYIWDFLIERFSRHIMDGTSVTPPDTEFCMVSSELGLRELARPNRLLRRNLGSAFKGAYMRSKTERVRMARTVYSKKGSILYENAYLILAVPYLDWMRESGFERFRAFRNNVAELYCHLIFLRFDYVEKVVAVIVQPQLDTESVSEDLMVMIRPDYTADDIKRIEADLNEAGIGQNLSQRDINLAEFPAF